MNYVRTFTFILVALCIGAVSVKAEESDPQRAIDDFCATIAITLADQKDEGSKAFLEFCGRATGDQQGANSDVKLAKQTTNR